ncbi:PaaX family transcriptional regulator C-terminal domain-containing protein [Actinomycetospora straminea]|uniref:PaaX family transcriptional regulator C-terminal domain-containing protein n=1 Tax=Actinomycetospora straminea TaxID=663607 RepID=A0ABP9F1F7_9PSEU|nr:PaaX family transcriptional regulator C-terminal domain-containing protein [Actinomycetospora straminea]MDD7932877.1 PaaX family transcriptional regulator C-terminal domain-containing protein [Actinomycetospora straminea]
MSTLDESAPDARPDPFSRRREVAATSARSLLVTVLGELVLPRGTPVWTQTVVDVLGLVGVEEKSARQALARTAADGMLVSERVGRRVRWDLTPWGRDLLTEGAARIYAHGRTRTAWDGRWLVVVASVPEQQRARRHRLRTRLAWAGLGSPAAGMWVSPDTERLEEVREVLAEHGPADAHVVTGEYHGELTAGELATRAWDLGDLEARYEEFVDRFAALEPAEDPATLAAQVRLVDAWRRFPFLDPGLPDALLPAPWVGHRAAEVFHGRHTAWADGALRAATALGL